MLSILFCIEGLPIQNTQDNLELCWLA